MKKYMKVRSMKVKALLTVFLVGVSVQFGAVYAEGFGISDEGNGSNAKIEALLQNVQSPSASSAAPQQQAPAAQSAPALSADPVRNEAFATMSRNMLPLTPEQIKLLHYLFDRTQNAAAEYPGTPPKPTSTSLIVKMSPGAAPPLVRLRQGFVTSLVFIDATGAPWPIQAFDLGDPKSFDVKWDQKGNTLMVQAQKAYQTGNLAVILKDLNTPIMLTLMPGQRAVDYRVDLRIPSLGPNASPDLVGLPGTESVDLASVLDGVPPDGSRALEVSGGGDTQAWLSAGRLFLRTPMTLVSPGFLSTMSSSDGTHAYELKQVPVILAQSRGKTVTLTIKGL